MMRPDFGRMNLDIFRGRDPGGVLWQPRIEFWYKVNKKRGTIPPDGDIERVRLIGEMVKEMDFGGVSLPATHPEN